MDSIAIDLELIEITCVGADNGECFSEITGGTAPYQILWSTGETTPFIDNLSEGDYSIQVTDANFVQIKTDQ